MILTDSQQELLRACSNDEDAYQQLLALFTEIKLEAIAAAEASTYSERKRYQALFERTNDAVFTMSLEGVLIGFNQRALDLLGYTADEIQGKFANSFVIADEHAEADQKFKLIRSGVIPPVYERTYQRKDGSGIQVEINAALIYDDENNPLFIQSIVRDITARKRDEQTALEREKLQLALQKEHEVSNLKTQIMMRISHEFRTPLAIILTSSQLLQRYYDRMSADDRRNHMDRIQRQIQRITDLLEDISFIIQDQIHTKEFTPTRFNLYHLCSQVIERLHTKSGAKHVLTLNDHDADQSVSADAHLVDSILTHLLTNAIKYSPAGARIQLYAAIQYSEIILRVSDEGIGIPESEQEHIFEPFYRASNVTEVGGVGMGLSMVREAVLLHGGDITVESRVREGTTFTVRLQQLPANTPITTLA